MRTRTTLAAVLLAGAVLGLLGVPAQENEARPSDDPLPSWSEGASKKAILDFVGRVTKKEGKEYVAPAERVAVFDNDGTLWPENPVPFEIAFVFDRVKAMA